MAAQNERRRDTGERPISARERTSRDFAQVTHGARLNRTNLAKNRGSAPIHEGPFAIKAEPIREDPLDRIGKD